jgi:biopolymer transport protein ExbD
MNADPVGDRDRTAEDEFRREGRELTRERMQFHRTGFESDTAEMNMTPMIDVVFLLIIFFMAAYQLSEAQTSGRVDLPEASHAYPSERRSPNTVVIEVVSGAGFMRPVYMVAGKVYLPTDASSQEVIQQDAGTWMDLRALLAQTVAQAKAQMEPLPPVIVHADRRVQYKYVQHLMALCVELGISDFSFEARQPAEG